MAEVSKHVTIVIELKEAMLIDDDLKQRFTVAISERWEVQQVTAIIPGDARTQAAIDSERPVLAITLPAPVGVKTGTTLTFDWSHIEEADDEIRGTTYFGGSFSLNKKEYLVNGSDRDGMILDQIQEAIEDVLGQELADAEFDAFMETDVVSCQINGIITLA